MLDLLYACTGGFRDLKNGFDCLKFSMSDLYLVCLCKTYAEYDVGPRPVRKRGRKTGPSC